LGDGVTIKIGTTAPDFALTASDGTTHRLGDYLGKPLVLVFYPGDDSPVCTRQLRDYNAGLDRFDALDAQIVGISPQSVESKSAFTTKHGFRFPLLADTEKAVAAAYGTLGPVGFPRRSVFIVDRDGVVRYAHRAIAGLNYRPIDVLIEALEDLA
jgi:peroxiredoxin Q/BCP